MSMQFAGGLLLLGASQLPFHLFCQQVPARVPRPQAAPIQAVEDEFFGVRIADPYRWLENQGNPDVMNWMRQQNDYTHKLLSQLPGRERLLQRIRVVDYEPQLLLATQRLPDGSLFQEKREPSDNMAKLYRTKKSGGASQVVVDPERITGTAHPSITYFTPTDDGRLVACGIAEGGSEDAVIYVVDTATGKAVGERIDRARYGSVAWIEDGRSFIYNRQRAKVPEAEAKFQTRVYLHRMGTDPDVDQPLLGYEVDPAIPFSSIDIPRVVAIPGADFALVQGSRKFYAASFTSVKSGHPKWNMIFQPADQVGSQLFDVFGDYLYGVSRKNSPRGQIVRRSVTNPSTAAMDIVYEPAQGVITGLSTAKDGLYVLVRNGVGSRVWRLQYDRPRSAAEIALPLAGTAHFIAGDQRIPGTLLLLGSWSAPPRIYSYDPGRHELRDTHLQEYPPMQVEIESTLAMARSHDGTSVPISIAHRKGLKLDASHPALVWAYGAYGMEGGTPAPFFDPRSVAWMERGGIVAVAHVRGGGEYGEDWHRAGMKVTKPNSWLDLIACAEYLIENKYTTRARLGITGQSAGGIVIGRAITARPDLFAAAVSDVGLSEMLRAELTPNGPGNVREFGTVKIEEEFRALYEMSPYHHVQSGVAYPAVMLTAGMNDKRVVAWQPAKFAARLQAATSGSRPILLSIDYDAGHGVGTGKSQSQEALADKYAFLLWQFGDPDFQFKDVGPGK